MKNGENGRGEEYRPLHTHRLSHILEVIAAAERLFLNADDDEYTQRREQQVRGLSRGVRIPSPALKANPTHSPFKGEDQAEQEGRQRKSESQVCQGLAIEVETQRAKCAVIEYPPRDPRSQQDRISREFVASPPKTVMITTKSEPTISTRAIVRLP